MVILQIYALNVFVIFLTRPNASVYIIESALPKFYLFNCFFTWFTAPLSGNYCLISHKIFKNFVLGLSTVFAPLYLAEISPINLRGSIGTIHQLLLTLGILISEILGLGKC